MACLNLPVILREFKLSTGTATAGAAADRLLTVLTLIPELPGVGPRSEDDVLVTSAGSEVLSEALPIDADGLETWTRDKLGQER